MESSQTLMSADIKFLVRILSFITVSFLASEYSLHHTCLVWMCGSYARILRHLPYIRHMLHPSH